MKLSVKTLTHALHFNTNDDGLVNMMKYDSTGNPSTRDVTFYGSQQGVVKLTYNDSLSKQLMKLLITYHQFFPLTFQLPQERPSHQMQQGLVGPTLTYKYMIIDHMITDYMIMHLTSVSKLNFSTVSNRGSR